MSKPKIVVLHMRELIYTAIFIFLILVLLILLFLMFRPHDASNTPDTETKTTFSSSADADSVGYQPGEQICQKQSLDGITCSRENKYTSELLFQAIKNSLAKAQR